MRKYLIRWWFTSNWERDCYTRAIVLWNDGKPEMERLIAEFNAVSYVLNEVVMPKIWADRPDYIAMDIPGWNVDDPA